MKKRTTQQNKSLHKYFEMMSEVLNDGGYGVQVVLKETPELDWNAHIFKETIWRRIQKKKTGKTSSAELESGELQIVWEETNRFLGQKFGVHCAFPSLESMTEALGKVEYPQEEYDPEF